MTRNRSGGVEGLETCAVPEVGTAIGRARSDRTWVRGRQAGLGEAIIKATLARQAVDQLGVKDPSEVAAHVVAQLERFGGDGGLILVDARGRVGFGFNSQRMARAWVDSQGREGSGFGR